MDSWDGLRLGLMDLTLIKVQLRLKVLKGQAASVFHKGHCTENVYF